MLIPVDGEWVVMLRSSLYNTILDRGVFIQNAILHMQIIPMLIGRRNA